MEITKHTLELAARFDEDHAELKAAMERIHDMDLGQKEQAKTFHVERKLVEKEAHVLRGKLRESGQAQEQIRLALPQELRVAIEQAELLERELASKLKSARGELGRRTSALERVSKEAKQQATIDQAEEHVVKAREEHVRLEDLHELAAEKAARVRATARTELERIRQEALKPEPKKTKGSESGGETPKPAA